MRKTNDMKNELTKDKSKNVIIDSHNSIKNLQHINEMLQMLPKNEIERMETFIQHLYFD